MIENIEKYYNLMIEQIPEFAAFVQEHKYLTTEELAKMYNITIENQSK